MSFSRSQPGKGRPYPGRGRRDRPAPAELPREYLESLKTGYFDEKGELKQEFITTGAEQIAKGLGATRKLAYHQLRRFFDHARLAERIYRSPEKSHTALIQIKKLGVFAADAKGRGKIPDLFYDFVQANLKAIGEDPNNFKKGFMPHFEAVVGYCACYLPKETRRS